MYQVIGATKTRTMRVLWTLEELGVAYDHQPESPRSDAVKRLNPSGKIPVLIADGAILTDSIAIVTFLADKHGALTHPAGSVARARQDGLTQMVIDELDAILWAAAKHSFVLPEAMRRPDVKDSLKWEWSMGLERLADRMDGPFLTGDTFTIADIICAHCLNWGSGIRFDVSPEPLRDYQKRMRARPAFQRLVA